MTEAMNTPKVSVLVMTYNHAAFIREALDSVLAQELDDDFEVIVSEDRSTDGTREIVQEYQRRDSDKVRPIFSDVNLHDNTIVTRGIEAARGKYVALLDGDDYWTSKEKLRKQVEFLEKHENCSMCFHNAVTIDETGKRNSIPYTRGDMPEFFLMKDIWMGNPFATCSAMFRSGLVKRFPEWYIDLFPITDWPLYILHAEHGPFGYIDEVMGAYRLHKGGLFSSVGDIEKIKKVGRILCRMNEGLGHKYDRFARISRSRYFFDWGEDFLMRKDLKTAYWCFRQYLKGAPFVEDVSIGRVVRFLTGLVRLTISRGGK